MSEQPKIAKITAVVNGGELSVERLIVKLAVNMIPTASVVVARKADKVVHAPISDEILSIIKGRQDTRLAGVRKPDMLIVATDGLYGSLHFSGYLTAPVIDISTTSTSDSLTVMGVDGVLDALDMSIYKAGTEADRVETSVINGASLEKIPAATTGNVTGLIKKVSEILYGNMQGSIDVETHDTMKKLIEQQHTVNTGEPYDTWLKILSNSKVEYESWAAVTELSPTVAYTMSNRVKDILTQKTGGFQQTMNMLMATFQMYYIPDTTKPGKMMRADAKVIEPTGTMELSATSLSLSDGSHRLLPVGGVVIVIPAAKKPRPESGPPVGTESVAAQWPDPLLFGFVQREVPPAWMVYDDGVPILGTKVDKSSDSDDKGPSYNVGELIKRQEAAAEYKRDVSTKCGEALTEFCKVMFLETQLAHSTAEASVPLNFKIKVGERVTVNIAGGSGSFAAFVNSVTHMVDLRLGKELNSYTQIGFTHVKY